jgi:hypothetical protein
MVDEDIVRCYFRISAASSKGVCRFYSPEPASLRAVVRRNCIGQQLVPFGIESICPS